VNRTVKDNKDPDGGGLVVDAGPHGDHGAGMVVGLEERRATAFEDDDDRVNNLIELGEVKEIAPISKRVIPERVIDIAILSQEESGVFDSLVFQCRLTLYRTPTDGHATLRYIV